MNRFNGTRYALSIAIAAALLPVCAHAQTPPQDDTQIGRAHV